MTHEKVQVLLLNHSPSGVQVCSVSPDSPPQRTLPGLHTPVQPPSLQTNEQGSGPPSAKQVSSALPMHDVLPGAQEVHAPA
jgi:hypothetical protein